MADADVATGIHHHNHNENRHGLGFHLRQEPSQDDDEAEPEAVVAPDAEMVRAEPHKGVIAPMERQELDKIRQPGETRYIPCFEIVLQFDSL